MKCSKYTICVYSTWEDDKPNYSFGANTKRAVVGLMKTIMDNFDPAHVDIMKSEEGSQ